MQFLIEILIIFPEKKRFHVNNLDLNNLKTIIKNDYQKRQNKRLLPKNLTIIASFLV